MKWKPVAWNSDQTIVYAVQSDCGRFHVAKTFDDGCTLYSLADQGQIIKWDEDKEVLIELANELKNASK